MKWVWRAAVTLVVAVGGIVLVGWFLPQGHVATRSARLNQSPQTVYAVIADVASYPQWWADVSRVEMLEATNGRTRFRQHTGMDAVIFEVEEDVPPRRFGTRIADPDQPFGGTWTFELTPEGAGTRVTITERGEVFNPIFRFMSRFVFSHTATLDSFLRALGRRLGEEVQPA